MSKRIGVDPHLWEAARYLIAAEWGEAASGSILTDGLGVRLQVAWEDWYEEQTGRNPSGENAPQEERK